MEESKNKRIELVSIIIAIVGVLLPRTSFQMEGVERSFQSGIDYILLLFRVESFTEWFSNFLSGNPLGFLMFWIQYITYTIAILLLVVNLFKLIMSFDQHEIESELAIEEKKNISQFAFILFIITGVAFLISWIHNVVSIGGWQFMSIRLSIGYFVTLIASGFPVIYLNNRQNYH